MDIEGFGVLPDGVSLADEPLRQFYLLGVQLLEGVPKRTSLPLAASRPALVRSRMRSRGQEGLVEMSRGRARRARL